MPHLRMGLTNIFCPVPPGSLTESCMWRGITVTSVSTPRASDIRPTFFSILMQVAPHPHSHEV